MNKLSIKDIPINGKTVLARVDFNVPLDETGHITDTTRIDLSLDTIQYLLQHGAKIILMSHLGKVEGTRDVKYSLAPCAKYLSQVLHHPVILAPDCIGPEVESLVKQLQPGDILLLENLRFHLEETKPENVLSFAKELASYGDIFVNDAFGTSHRKHSSIYFVPQLMPKISVTGFLVEKELHFLSDCFMNPKRPFSTIIGGAKVSSKLGVLYALANKADHLFIGGAMAFTFLKAQGVDVASSKVEQDQLETAKKILNDCKHKNIQLHLPEDIIYAEKFDNTAAYKTFSIAQHPPKEWIGMDIGPKTLQTWIHQLKNSNTIFWNGPVGVFEMSHFAKGTFELATYLSTHLGIRIIGGGDSVAAINQLGLAKKFSHISSGGGASLEFIEHGSLPAIDILTPKHL
ncbi:MAG: phosphoglycerate kinase [Chlamydiales bacterium]|nr:phosphoglycerate kinase [Chlamydiales bacterium]